MDIEALVGFAWIVWIALILLFFIIEMNTLEFTFLMLAIGSVAGLVGGLLGLPWWAQILLAAALSVVLIAAVKPPLLRRLRRGEDPAKTLVDALIGQSAIAVTDFLDGAGQAKLANGEVWTARTTERGHDPHVGDRLVVTAIEGATAMVASESPAERTIS